MEVFSRFHWLVALSTKHVKIVRDELEKIYSEHSCPKVLQSDRGGEWGW